MNTVERLEKIIASPRLRPSSKAFVESLQAQASKKDLSAKQLEYVEKFWIECFPPAEIEQAEREWIESFTDEMRADVHIMGEYYEKHYPSSRMAKHYKEPNWLPTKEIFEKSVASDWGKRVLNNHKAAFRFKVGDMCALRDTARNRSQYREQMGNPLLVLECIKNVNREFTNHYIVIDSTKMEDQRQFPLPESAVNVIKEKKNKG